MDELNAVIEVDGEQHFSPDRCFGSDENERLDRFACIVKHDQIKDNYCLCNAIPIIRVSYLDFKSKEWKSLIDNFIALFDDVA